MADFEYVDNIHEDVQANSPKNNFFEIVGDASEMLMTPLTKPAEVVGDMVTPEGARNALNLSGMPARGVRGLGVLATGGELNRAAEATQPGFKPKNAGEYLADVGADLTDLRGLLVGQALGMGLKAGGLAIKGMQPTVARLLSATSGINKASFNAIMREPEIIMAAKPLSEAKTILQAAQKAAGLTEREARELALKPELTNKLYLDIMEKIDAGKDVTVKELIKVKQAGWKISQRDYSISGQIAEDISKKVDPLLEKQAPEIAEAYQTYHLSKLKNVFNEILPQTKKGDVSFVKSAVGVAASNSGTQGLWAALMSPSLAGTIAKTTTALSKGMEALGGSAGFKQATGGFTLRQILEGKKK